ncbi:MAG: T9SS type A sorting domain-containing protein, partial [Candidatus Eisenbacteria bacterium]|nr:T9SS type A sorting domain-containing protein [Candidatus Eisenbacteria bacterium]
LVSVNGIDWEVITPDGDYPFDFVFSLVQPGYSGRQSTWTPAEFDLTSFLGESSVWIKFNFASDTGLAGPGWFIDDVQILENQALALPLRVGAVSGRNALVPVSWDSPGGVPTDKTSPILGYTVYRTEDQEIWTKLNKELLSETEFLDDTALNGNFYDYAVTATYEDGESPLSDFATAIPYVAGYESNTTAIAAQLDEGDSEVQTLSLTNDGTGFLQMNIFEAGPDHVLDDIRIRFDFPDPTASKGGVLGQAEVALPEVSESVSINSDVSDQLRKAYMEAMGISAAEVKASGSVEKPSSRDVVKFKAIPPTGSYVDVFTDPADLAAPGFPDLKDIGFQFEDGSFYVRVTSHQVWGSFQGFNLSISFDVDQNPDTGGFAGDYLLLAGAIPINNPNIGAPAVLLDGNFNIVGFPHHLIQQDNTDEAEWGFFASTINAGNSMYVSATTLAPNGQIPLDSAPNGVNISWIGREATHYEVFQQASVEVPINLVADLAPATYTAQLLVETNDPTAREVAIPVSLQVDEVVPVRLLAFDASSGDLGVNLKWKTAEETDHLGFHVYRRTGAEETEVRINGDLVLARRAGEYVFEDRDVVPGETYSYRLGDMSRDGSIRFHSPVAIRFAGTELLGAPVLRQSSPNPLVSATSIRFGLPEQDRVSLAIYSITGQRVRVLAQNESFGDGFHEVTWDGRDEAGRRVAAGVYTYRLQTSRSVMQQKLVVVR